MAPNWEPYENYQAIFSGDLVDAVGSAFQFHGCDSAPVGPCMKKPIGAVAGQHLYITYWGTVSSRMAAHHLIVCGRACRQMDGEDFGGWYSDLRAAAMTGSKDHGIWGCSGPRTLFQFNAW